MIESALIKTNKKIGILMKKIITIMIFSIVALYLIITTGPELSQQDIQSAYMSYLNKKNR